MSTQPRTFLPPPSECLALIIATLELLPFGLISLHNPTFFANNYGLPLSPPPPPSPSSSSSNPTTQTDPQTKKALIAAIAARNMQNGILMLTFGLVLRDRRSLGVVVLAGVVATVADCVIVRAYGVREKIMGHYVGVVNSLVVGGSLLFWNRGGK